MHERGDDVSAGRTESRSGYSEACTGQIDVEAKERDGARREDEHEVEHHIEHAEHDAEDARHTHITLALEQCGGEIVHLEERRAKGEYKEITACVGGYVGSSAKPVGQWLRHNGGNGHKDKAYGECGNDTVAHYLTRSAKVFCSDEVGHLHGET